MTLTVAILGANGQIGTALARAVSRSPSLHGVAIVRNRMAGALLQARIGAEIELRIGSLDSTEAAAHLLEGCTAAVNCALASAGGFRFSRLANQSLIESITTGPGLESIIHLSSVAVYGNGRRGRSAFDSPIPTTTYGREKLVHEAMARRAATRSSAKLTILRVGHLYGSELPMSRFIIDALNERSFGLPYRGLGSSNCISRPRLASAIINHLVAHGEPGIYDLSDHPQTTWRSIFDYHADALGVSRAADLDDERSDCAKATAYASNDDSWMSIIASLFRLMRPTGISGLSGVQSIRSRGDALLANAPEYVENVFRRSHVKIAVKYQMKMLSDLSTRLPDWMFHPGMPGPVIAGVLPASDLLAEIQLLRAWNDRCRDPRWEFGGIDCGV